MPFEYVDDPTVYTLGRDESPSTPETAGAAFRLENDFVAAYDLLTRPRFTEVDQNFNAIEQAQRAQVNEIFRPRLAEAQSQDQFDWMLQRIQQEEHDRQILARSGWSGVVWGMAAGLISPTTLLPIATPGRGVKAVASAFGLAAIAAGTQEAVLLAAQETRTMDEALLNITTGTVLGGLLGSAAVYLRKGDFDRIASDMADPHGGRYVSEGAPIGSRGEALSHESLITKEEAENVLLDYQNARLDALTAAEKRLDAVVAVYGDVLPEGKVFYRGITPAGIGVPTRDTISVSSDFEVARAFSVARNEGTLTEAFAETPDLAAPLPIVKIKTAAGTHGLDVNKFLGPKSIKKGEAETILGPGELRPTGKTEIVDDGVFKYKIIEYEYIPMKTKETPEPNLSQAAGAQRRGEIGRLDSSGNWVPLQGVKSSFWLGRQLGKLSPIVRAANSKYFPEMTSAILRLSDAGIQWVDTAGRLVAPEGGTVENVVKQWNGNLYKFLYGLDEIYSKHLGSATHTGARLRSHAMSLGLAERGGKMTRKEFNEEVTRAAWSNDTHPVPEVAEAAKLVREIIYDPLGKAAAEASPVNGESLLDPRYLEPDPVSGIKLKTVGAENYVNRIYNVEKIINQESAWLSILIDHAKARMTAAFWKRYEKIAAQQKRLVSSAEDLALNEEEVAKAIAEVKDELASVEQPSNALTLSDEVDFLRAQARAAEDPEEAARLKAEAKDVEASNKDVQDFRRDRGALRSRLRTLQRSAGRVSTRRREKLERVEKIEADQLKSLGRVERAAVRAEQALAKVSDAKLDKEARKAFERLAREGTLFDKGEDKILSLLEEEQQTAKKAESEAFPGEVKVKLSAAVQRDLGALYPEEFTKLGLGANSVVPAAQMRAFASRVERELTGADVPKAVKGRIQKALNKVQDAIRKTMTKDQADYFEAVAVAAKLDEAAARQEARIGKLQDLALRLENVESIDRQFVRDFIAAAREDVARKTNDLNSRRAVRQERLRQQAEKLNPEYVREHAASLRDKADNLLSDFLDTTRARGGAVDLAKMEADFTEAATENAIQVTERIKGSDPYRIVGLSILTEKRGPELARTLDVPNEKIADFLEMDIETNSRAYVRTMAPDIELFRTYGDANGANLLADIETKKRTLIADAQARKDAGEISAAEADRLDKELSEEVATFKAIFAGSVERLKHIRGLPADAKGFGFRAAKVALDLNSMRLMGAVVISSVPDIARPIMKYGLLNTFREGWLPMIKSMQEFKQIAREMHYAGTGNDIYMSGRASSIFDTFDEYGRGTAFERGLNYAANRIGNVALFNHWTQWQKTIVASVVNGKFWDAIEAMGKGNASREAVDFLAEVGVNESNWRRFVQQMEDGNVRKVNGVWLPNTEDWTDVQAVRTYRAMIAKHADDTIVTPGLERPLIMDKSPAMRLLFQFRSFAFASNTKMMLAGLQNPDIALANGVLLSLAAGAFGYYTYAWAAGGNILKTMQNAGPDKWVDEAIARSGLLGVFGEMQRIGERLPGLQHVSTFSGQRTTNRGGDKLIDTLLGPSYGLARNGAAFLTGLESPTESTLHKFRQMVPFQNVWYLRRVLDKVEQGSAETLNLPRTRK